PVRACRDTRNQKAAVLGREGALVRGGDVDLHAGDRCARTARDLTGDPASLLGRSGCRGGKEADQDKQCCLPEKWRLRPRCDSHPVLLVEGTAVDRPCWTVRGHTCCLLYPARPPTADCLLVCDLQ